ncbi:hypothetical protein BASA81_016865 [Batrachochytrium salamandrivorans]|nr:hypothetical protein BASA81_016865 [Batrachochytrium salamandrivorans]
MGFDMAMIRVYWDGKLETSWAVGKVNPPPAAWTIEIAQFIKSLAPRTMVIDGNDGRTQSKRTSPREVLQTPFVDVISNNYYFGLEDLPRYSFDSAIHGGFYTHFEKDDFWSYHVPGFAPTRGFTADEGSIVMTLRKHALKVQGRSPSEAISSSICSRINRRCGHHRHFVWIGSAWASHYILSRRDCSGPGCVSPTTNRESITMESYRREKVTDNVNWG